MKLGVISILSVLLFSTANAEVNTIPEDLLIGAATAAYQVEGAWNISGKGESIWDRLVHTHPDWIADGNTADVTDDSYHNYEKDIKALKDIGMQHYRFSIAWTRILPTGDITNVNQDGIDYYNALIDGLIEKDIIPVVTMYHWDLPQALQDLGGWTNDIIVDYFQDYARLLFTEFGDRVKWWVTFNEPLSIVAGYRSTKGKAPGVNAPGVGEYLAGYTILKAHAIAYHLYDEWFRDEYQGKVSIVLNTDYFFPKTDSDEDLRASEIALQSNLGWFAHPIYSEEGDYPAILKELIGNQSRAEGRNKSRLPELGDDWIDYIKGTYDYFGLNHYSSQIVSASNDSSGYEPSIDPSWPASSTSWLYYVPEGFRRLINWVTREYNNPDIFITENGWADYGGLNDSMRVQYINAYMSEMLKAIHLDNSSVIGYTVWSIIDNFEWNYGFSVKLGIYEVDFDDEDRPRTPKDSAKALAEIISTRQISEEYFKDVL